MQNYQGHGRGFSSEKDLDGWGGGHMAQKCNYNTIGLILLTEFCIFEEVNIRDRQP